MLWYIVFFPYLIWVYRLRDAKLSFRSHFCLTTHLISLSKGSSWSLSTANIFQCDQNCIFWLRSVFYLTICCFYLRSFYFAIVVTNASNISPKSRDLTFFFRLLTLFIYFLNRYILLRVFIRRVCLRNCLAFLFFLPFSLSAVKAFL